MKSPPHLAFDLEPSRSLYLDRCQVDTPVSLVNRVWQFIRQRRQHVGTVLDLGAGDARFAQGEEFESYLGIEIDPSRSALARLPDNARLLHQCAFEAQLTSADICLGNPPYVRNQDLPTGWRQRAARVIEERLRVKVSGLANAWQYFTFLALASAKPDGLVALVIPYEWVSRPSARSLRAFVQQNRWSVDCYRLLDRTFDHVLTTCSITLIDKSATHGDWKYFQEAATGAFEHLRSPSGGLTQLAYRPRQSRNADGPRAKRGLSPGTQRWLVLSEGARIRYGLRIGRDVVPSVTSLRPLRIGSATLTKERFKTQYRDAGARCWLIRTDRELSPELSAYLAGVPNDERDTWTCRSRDEWWRFDMPKIPELLVATGFRGRAPKVVYNEAKVVSVGSVTGIYDVSPTRAKSLGRTLRTMDLRNRIVSHSNGLRKLEVGQLQALIENI